MNKEIIEVNVFEIGEIVFSLESRIRSFKEFIKNGTMPLFYNKETLSKLVKLRNRLNKQFEELKAKLREEGEL